MERVTKEAQAEGVQVERGTSRVREAERAAQFGAAAEGLHVLGIKDGAWGNKPPLNAMLSPATYYLVTLLTYDV